MYFVIHRRRINLSWVETSPFMKTVKQLFWGELILSRPTGWYIDCKKQCYSYCEVICLMGFKISLDISKLAWNRVKQLLGETSKSKAVKGRSLDIRPSLAGVLRFGSVDLFTSGSQCDLLRMFYALQKIALNLVVKVIVRM